MFVLAGSYKEFLDLAKKEIDETAFFKIYDYSNHCEIKESIFEQYVKQYSSSPTCMLEMIQIVNLESDAQSSLPVFRKKKTSWKDIQ